MGAIGGIVDFKNDGVDFARMNGMRLSMALRGRKRSSAFMCGGVGMFFNSSHIDEDDKEESRQPAICERRGYANAICMDGEGFCASALLEKYLVHGIEFLGLVDGAFSLALYDGERDMLILARDKKGRKPLFYRVVENKIFFASEVKGILDATKDSVRVNREALELHLTAPVGVYRAANIFPDVSEVLAGECILFTKLGMSRFFYREKRELKKAKPIRAGITTQKILSPYKNINFSMLDDYLREALIAFDYPQFDAFMPSLMQMLDEVNMAEKSSVFFEDGVRRKNLSYAYEREDRLGNMYGVEATGVLPRVAVSLDNEQLSCMKQELLNNIYLMGERELAILRSVLGERKLCALLSLLKKNGTKKEDTEQQVRTLGMLCQSVEWLQSRTFVIDDSSRIYCTQSV